MPLHHCSGIWDLLAGVTPVSQASCGQLCHLESEMLVFFLVVLKYVKLDGGCCRNAGFLCKGRWAGFCNVYKK